MYMYFIFDINFKYEIDNSYLATNDTLPNDTKVNDLDLCSKLAVSGFIVAGEKSFFANASCMYAVLVTRVSPLQSFGAW